MIRASIRLLVAAVFVPFTSGCGSTPSGDHDPGTADPISVVPISSAQTRATAPSLRFDGQNFIITWLELAEHANEWELYFASLRPGGELVSGPTPVTFLPDTYGQSRSAHLTDRSALWYRTSSRDLWALTYDSEGIVIDGPVRCGQAYDFDVEVRNGAFDLFARTHDGTYYQIEHRQYDTQLAQVGATVNLDPGASSKYSPSATWMPQRNAYYFAFTRGSRLRHMQYDPALVPPSSSTMLSTGNDQGGLQTTLDASGGVLFNWWDRHYDRRVFSYGTSDGPVWDPPRVLMPRNRDESSDASAAALGDEVLIAAQSNAETLLPQIRIGRITPAAGEIDLRDVVTLSDPAYQYWDPVVVAGTRAFGVAFIGFVDGSARLYFATVQR